MNQQTGKSFKNFIIIWLGQLISSIGSGLTAFSLGIYIFQATNSATGYSLIILFAFLPAFLLKPIGGVLSDRYNRKSLMVMGDLGSALGLVLILCTGFTEIWLIYLGVAISSIFVAVQNPAYKAAITDLVDEEAYSKASGLTQLAESSRFLLSPIIAGFLLNYLDISQVLVIDIATFLLAALAVLLIKPNAPKGDIPSENTNFVSDLVAGFNYVLANKGILLLLLITSLITFSIGFLQSLIGPMILTFTDSQSLGISQSVSATGMLISSFLLGVFSKTTKYVPILSISLGFCGLFYVLFGVSTNIIFITISGFLFFLTLPFINTSLDVMLRKNVDNTIQGRVWSIVSLLSQIGMAIAFLAAGPLADYVFNPLFQNQNLLYSTIGAIIGTGPGRGIGFMFILSGIITLMVAIIIPKIKSIRALDSQ